MDRLVNTTHYQETLLKSLARSASRLKSESAAILLQCTARAFISRRRARIAVKKRELSDYYSAAIVDRFIDEAILLGAISVVNEVLPSHNSSVIHIKNFNVALVSVTEQLCDEHVDAFSFEIIRETITETIDFYMEQQQSRAKKNPLVRIVLDTLDNSVDECIKEVVRLAINEIINDYLVAAHCQRGLDGLFSELMNEMGLPLVTEAWQEVAEITTLNSIINDVVSSLANELSRISFKEMIDENREQYERAQVDYVGSSACKVIGKQVLISHLMYLMGRNFDSIIVQRMAKGVVNANIMNRLLAMINYFEFEISNMRLNKCGRQLMGGAIEAPIVDMLISRLKGLSSDIVDDIDNIER